MNESDIKSYFKDCGTIDSIEIPRDHITMRPKGYVLIEFSRSSEAKDAVNLLNGFEIEGKRVKVQIYNEFVQKELNAIESKKETESLDQDSGLIHSSHARSQLMQKFMQSRDVDMGLAGLTTPEKPVQTNCILISNMFDPSTVNLDKDPYFYIEIKQ